MAASGNEVPQGTSASLAAVLPLGLRTDWSAFVHSPDGEAKRGQRSSGDGR
jgi:hypothetical protein